MLAAATVLFGLVALFSTTFAAPTKDQAGAQLLAELSARTGLPPAVVARQLLGGGTGYAPYQVPCPTGWTWVRPADSLATAEREFIQKRRQYSSAIGTMMASQGLPDPPRTPNIGFALSGGGYRAMIAGLGGVMATMNQSAEAASSGTGGWFDGVTYMAGLSGGSWGTGTFMANGGMMPLDLISQVWNLESNLVFPDNGKLSFYSDLVATVNDKDDEGFPTQITDYWALALGNHLLPSQYHLDGSPNLTFSALPSVEQALGNASLPMPIIIAAEREPGEIVIAENATVYEFTPYEFGSWAFGSDTKVRGAFTPTEYLGSSLNAGQPNGTCWKGFDQLSFVMGTSSTLFNSALIALNTSSADGVIKDAIQGLLTDLGEAQSDVSRVPNSFAKWDDQPNPVADLRYLTLIDAGETNQNIPLEPLLIPQRNVDAILAFDNSADTTLSWPNGSALYTTYTRAAQLATQQDVGIRMPKVPSTAGFVNGGFNTRPTFFGCNDTTTPLIVYVPNYPWSTYSNISTFQLEYDQQAATNLMLSGMRSLTLNGSIPTWPTCLACALSDRSFAYDSSNRTAECQSCFDTFCWDGQDNATMPNEYAPVAGTVPNFFTERGLTSETGTNAPANASDATGNTGESGAGARRMASGWATLASVMVGALMGVMIL